MKPVLLNEKHVAELERLYMELPDEGIEIQSEEIRRLMAAMYQHQADRWFGKPKSTALWLSVNDALPDYEQMVFAIAGDRMNIVVRQLLDQVADPGKWEWLNVEEPFWNVRSSKWECPNVYWEEGFEPTHWMPLPNHPGKIGGAT